MRLAIGMHNIPTTGQIGDRREAAAEKYVLGHARPGDVDDMIAALDTFAYTKSLLVSVGDEKGALLDDAVRRADPRLALELGTYCGYGALRIARAAPSARIYSVELCAANAEIAQRIWAHAGVDDRVTCVVGTIGDDGHTLDVLAGKHGFSEGALDFLFLDHDKAAYLADLPASLGAAGCPGSIVVADNMKLPARRHTANTCSKTKAAAGPPSSTRRTASIRPYSETSCWNPSCCTRCRLTDDGALGAPSSSRPNHCGDHLDARLYQRLGEHDGHENCNGPCRNRVHRQLVRLGEGSQRAWRASRSATKR